MEQNKTEKKLKSSKRNVKMIIIIMVLFIIGIIIRWDYVSTEISEGWKRGFNPEKIENDSVKIVSDEQKNELAQ